MKTAITEMFGIDVPILAFTHCRDVVAAVTKAGGLGVLGAVGHSERQLAIDLDWIEAEVGDRPYGVDLIVPARYAGAEQGGLAISDLASKIPAANRAFVDDLLERYGVPELSSDEVSKRGVLAGRSDAAPFSAARAAPQLEVALAHRPVLVVNALGPPPPEMIERVKQAGRRVGALAGAAVHAERHVAAGVDVIIAQGSEAGGHTGEVGTMVLVPEIVDVVRAMTPDVPVLAAGGIGRGRQMAAAMALGADGVWCGSVWLTTEEAETHSVVKEKMLRARSSDTIRSSSRTGKPARQLRTAWTDEWERPDAPANLGMPLQPILVDAAIRRIDRGAHRPGSGAEQLVNYFVGQIVGSMNEVKPAARVVYEMIEEFIDAVERLNAQTDG